MTTTNEDLSEKLRPVKYILSLTYEDIDDISKSKETLDIYDDDAKYLESIYEGIVDEAKEKLLRIKELRKRISIVKEGQLSFLKDLK